MRIPKLILLIIIPLNLFAQDFDISVNQINESILIDGKIDNNWSISDSVTLDYQLEPDYGKLPTKKTIIKTAQYKESIYFLIVSEISSKKDIVAVIQNRDNLKLSDDLIGIMLDTYNDKHNAFLFQVNPLGTLTDAKITNNGKTIDYLWDTEWEAKTSINQTNWIAEIRIPLSSIQFIPNSNSWGCNFLRSYRKNQEIMWWQRVTENYMVSQSGELTGFKTREINKHRLMIFPYGTSRYEDSDITGNHQTLKGDAGLDIQYKYSSNINANIAVNPDFATVEGDKTQINLTPYELKFPEKRLFFQDGNEMFDTRIQTFYSRRIGDILAGAKANGKFGKYQFNGIYANTKENKTNGIPSLNYNAFRVKRDFLESSTLGATYADKITDTLTYHTFSVDYNLNLGKEWKLTGQVVSSLPGDFDSHSAWYARFAKENNQYHYHIRYSNIGENFKDNVNETGFITDDDRKEVDSDVDYKFWLKGLVKYVKLSGKNNVFWSQSGVLRSWYLTYGGRCYLSNKLSADFYYNNEYKNWYRSISDNYYNHFYKGILGYNSDENNFIEVAYQYGANFKRDYYLFEMNTSFQILKKLTASYEFKYLHFSPDPKSESTVLNITGLGYYYNKDLWLRIFAQHNTNNNRIYFYGLAGWRFKPPFGALYLIYSSDNYEDVLFPDKIVSNILFIKLTIPITVIK